MKNVRIRVRESCNGYWFSFGIYEGKKRLMGNTACNDGSRLWSRKSAAIRNAKAIAKRIGIKYDSEIIKQHGC